MIKKYLFYKARLYRSSGFWYVKNYPPESYGFEKGKFFIAFGNLYKELGKALP